MRIDVSMRSVLRIRRLRVSALTTFDTSGKRGKSKGNRSLGQHELLVLTTRRSLRVFLGNNGFAITFISRPIHRQKEKKKEKKKN